MVNFGSIFGEDSGQESIWRFLIKVTMPLYKSLVAMQSGDQILIRHALIYWVVYGMLALIERHFSFLFLGRVGGAFLTVGYLALQSTTYPLCDLVFSTVLVPIFTYNRGFFNSLFANDLQTTVTEATSLASKLRRTYLEIKKSL